MSRTYDLRDFTSHGTNRKYAESGPPRNPNTRSPLMPILSATGDVSMLNKVCDPAHISIPSQNISKCHALEHNSKCHALDNNYDHRNGATHGSFNLSAVDSSVGDTFSLLGGIETPRTFTATAISPISPITDTTSVLCDTVRTIQTDTMCAGRVDDGNLVYLVKDTTLRVEHMATLLVIVESNVVIVLRLPSKKEIVDMYGAQFRFPIGIRKGGVKIVYGDSSPSEPIIVSTCFITF